MPGRTVSIETGGLVKRYENLTAVDNVDLRVMRGDVYGLLGSNGAGKTTIIHILTGILEPTSGWAKVAGLDTVKDHMDIKRRIGYLPELPALYERLTGLEYLQLIAGLRGMPADRIDGLVARYIKSMDLERHINLRMGAYSKGMKQKISFIAAVFHKPDILFLDEPTSGLDPRYIDLISQFIRDYARGGRTVFMSTHYTDLIEPICTRVGVMHRGRLIAQGPIRDVIKGAGAGSLQKAFINLTGGHISLDLDGV